MATRYYFPSSGSPPISPAFDAGWEKTTSAVRRLMSSTKASTAATDQTETENSTTNDYDVLLVQGVGPALAAQTITGTLKGNQGYRESSTSANARAQSKVYVVDSLGTTVRGVLIDFDTNALGTDEINVSASIEQNAYNPRGSGGQSVTSVVCQDGDRIVAEMGVRAHNTSSTTFTFCTELGDASANDWPEDQSTTNSTTTKYNNWIEFSQNLTLQGAGATYNDSFTESVTPGFTVAVDRTGNATTTDGVTPGHSNSVDRTASVTTTDGVTPGDSASPTSTASLSISEGVTPGDSCDAAGTGNCSTSEGVTPGFAATPEATGNIGTTDGVTPGFTATADDPIPPEPTSPSGSFPFMQNIGTLNQRS